MFKLVNILITLSFKSTNYLNIPGATTLMEPPKDLRVNHFSLIPITPLVMSVPCWVDSRKNPRLTIAQLPILLEPLSTASNMRWKFFGKRSVKMRFEIMTISITCSGSSRRLVSVQGNSRSRA
jgi:hypothetical protein